MYKNISDNYLIVYLNYKSQLKAYSKKQFDPFCRRERILFYVGKYNGVDNDPLRTTVGQLNFFRWAIQNKILDYIYDNYNASNIEQICKKRYIDAKNYYWDHYTQEGYRLLTEKISIKIKNM